MPSGSLRQPLKQSVKSPSNKVTKIVNAKKVNLGPKSH